MLGVVATSDRNWKQPVSMAPLGTWLHVAQTDTAPWGHINTHLWTQPLLPNRTMNGNNILYNMQVLGDPNIDGV